MALPATRLRSIPTLALAWSGGKDSALALWSVRDRGVVPGRLLTTVDERRDCVPMHGVRGELLRRQAACAGVPLVEVAIPAPCPNDVYEARMAQAFASAEMEGVEEVAFGDLFLDDIRAYREGRLAAVGKRALFPVWGLDTGELARRFVSLGFRAILVCVDPKALDRSFAGREFDEALLADLPDDVDPCGENGEFHTFVYDGPVFERAVECRPAGVVERDGFVFCDLVAEDG
jgi:uncharacterized protein (TIGR00290 family)